MPKRKMFYISSLDSSSQRQYMIKLGLDGPLWSPDVTCACLFRSEDLARSIVVHQCRGLSDPRVDFVIL